jgi:hypothetical protein
MTDSLAALEDGRDGITNVIAQGAILTLMLAETFKQDPKKQSRIMLSATILSDWDCLTKQLSMLPSCPAKGSTVGKLLRLLEANQTFTVTHN